MGKILLFEVITKLELGGAQLSLLDLVKSLDKTVYEISLLTGSEGGLLSDALSIEGLRVIKMPSLKRTINLFYDTKTLFLMYTLFKKEKPDIVHTHSSKAGILGRWAARLAGVKIIHHTVHGWEFHNYQNILKRTVYSFLERITAPLTDSIIAVTEHDIKKGLSLRIGTEHQYRLIRYGINKKQFNIGHNGLFRKQYQINKDCFIVGMIACFKPQKAPLDFIYSAALIAQRIPEVRFVMVGDGHMRPKITTLINRLGIKNKFILLGWRRDIPSLLSSFDIVVLSSLWEGLPIVFLEAMASGKPIVATDIDGNSEIVKNNVNGFLIKPRDHESFAARIIELYNNKELIQRMGKAGHHALNDQFDASRMVSDMNTLYRMNHKKEVAV